MLFQKIKVVSGNQSANDWLHDSLDVLSIGVMSKPDHSRNNQGSIQKLGGPVH